MMTNMAKGRKGMWHLKNSARWDRKENKAREAELREKAEFIHSFVNDHTILVEDTTRMYAGGVVREFPGSYLFELQLSPSSEILGVMAATAVLTPSS